MVDDLVKVEEGEAGTAGIFETELTSGLFYGYVVIDIGTLIDNVGGDTQLAASVVRHLLHLIATVTPGAKKGSTAPYAYADMMLVELGEAQPRSLAGAFRAPVPRTGEVLAEALKALNGQLLAFDTAYGGTERRAALCTCAADIPGVAAPISLDALADWAAQPLRMRQHDSLSAAGSRGTDAILRSGDGGRAWPNRRLPRRLPAHRNAG